MTGGVRGDGGAGRVGNGPPLPDEIDLTGFDAADLVALGETDRALDRLAARRPSVADLDDPAFAVLAALVQDVDAEPIPAPAPARDSRRVVRLRALAVAACTVVALYGVGAAATGSWAPWHPVGTGQVATADAEDLRQVLASGLRSVDADDVVAARAGLAQAVELLRTAELNPQERAQVERLLAQLAQALSDEGVPLDGVTLPPGVSSPTPSSMPTSGAAASVGEDGSDTATAQTDGEIATATSTSAVTGTATATATSGDTATATDTTTTSTVTTNPGGQTGKPSDVGTGTTKTKKPKKTKTTTDDA